MSKIYQPLNESLEKINREHHEGSTCLRCDPGETYRGAEWINRRDFPALDHFGWPLYFNEETGDVLFLSDYCHNLTIGSTGTGKTEVYIKNAIRLMSELPEALKPAFLITDQKGDLAEQMVPVLKKNGYTTFVMNAKSPYFSCHYNFLLPLYDRFVAAHKIKKEMEEDRVGRVFNGVTYADEAEAREMAFCIAQDHLDFVERTLVELAYLIIPSNKPQDESWYGGARNVLQAVIWGLLYDALEPELTGITREKFTLTTVLDVTRQTDDDCENLIDWLKRVPNNACVKNAISGVLDIKAKVTRDGYISTLQAAAAVFSASAIGAITATENSLDLHEIVKGEKPFAVVLITDDRQKATNSVAALLLNNFLNEAVDVADKSPNHALPRNFVVMADEFANMPALLDLDKRITTMRSRRVWMMMAIQSIQQLDRVYTPEVSGIVQDNCDLNLFLGCNNDDTKERFSRSMGSHLGVKTSYSIHNDGAVSVQKGSENVPLVKKSDLDALRLGEMYVRARRAQNLLTYITPYFSWAKDEPREDLRGGSFFAYDPAVYSYDVQTREQKERELRLEQQRKAAEERKRQKEESGVLFSNRKTDSNDSIGEETPLSRRFRALRESQERETIPPIDPITNDAEESGTPHADPAFDRAVRQGKVIGKADADSRICVYPRDGEQLLAKHNVRMEARAEGGWQITASVTDLEHKIEQKSDARHDSPRKWFEYKIEGDTFRASCSDSMRCYLLARLYTILYGPDHLVKSVIYENSASNLACVFKFAMNGNEGITRQEMLVKLRDLLRTFEEGEDWYMISTIETTIKAVEKMSDVLFGVVKRRIK